MNALDEKTKRFVEQIKSTGEFRKLKQSRDILAKDPDLKKKIMGFNQAQKELYSSPKYPEYNKEKTLAELNHQFESLSQIPQVAEYLRNYKLFNEFMMRINNTISISLEQELGFK